MEWNFLFFINSVLFGVGLAMDAFSVSLANGLNEPKMPAGRMCTIAGVFAFFQIIMPLIGWFCVRTVAETFTAFQRAVPWIALILLLYIGGKMLLEGIRGAKDGGGEPAAVSAGGLLLQGLAPHPSTRCRWASPLPIIRRRRPALRRLLSALSPLASA